MLSIFVWLIHFHLLLMVDNNHAIAHYNLKCLQFIPRTMHCKNILSNNFRHRLTCFITPNDCDVIIFSGNMELWRTSLALDAEFKNLVAACVGLFCGCSYWLSCTYQTLLPFQLGLHDFSPRTYERRSMMLVQLWCCRCIASLAFVCSRGCRHTMCLALLNIGHCSLPWRRSPISNFKVIIVKLFYNVEKYIFLEYQT